MGQVYEIADLRIRIDNRLPYTARLCRAYLSADQTSPFDFSVSVTDEEFYREKQLSQGYADGYIESVCIYRNLCLELPKYDRFLFHSSVVEYGGKGYAFSGKSGAGKSTHALLWNQYLPTSKIVNGDKPIVWINGDEVIVYGTAWQGKENLGSNTKTSLSSVCFIEQAKENKITQIPDSKAGLLLLSQVLHPTDEERMVKTISLVDKLVEKVPVYLLECDISKDAVKASFERMTGERFQGENV